MPVDELNKFGKYVKQQAKSKLTKNKPHPKKDTNSLYNGIDYDVRETTKGATLTFSFGSAEAYWQFVDKGVKGAKSSKKAPTSPFKFGTGGGGGSGGLTRGIKGWVRRKRIQFRNRKSGQFLSYEATSFLIIRSVWNTGLKTTNFFTLPFERAFLRLPDKIYAAYALRVVEQLKVILK
jgi:hypothetical protein